MGIVSSILAHVAVFLILFATAVIARLGRAVRSVLGLRVSRPPAESVRILLTGTFYNENWYRSHIRPLVGADRVSEILVVTEHPLFELSKVRYVCPPRWCARVLGRSVSRALTVLAATARYRPDLVMGYHIMPNALICLIAASLFGGRSVYQMTGGPIQVMGGGPGSENVLLRRLGRSSKLLEALLFCVLRGVDLIVVRGSAARRYVVENGLGRSSLILTGSIDTDRFRPGGEEADYDFLCVSRLVPCKGMEYLLEVVGALRALRPNVRVAVAGDGVLRGELEGTCRSLGTTDNVSFLGKRQDVEAVMRQSRVFVLTSPSEGMSIAMLEAMGSGLAAAVTDVGELRDAVAEGVNGIILLGDAPSEDAAKLHALLGDERTLLEMSRAARTLIEERYGVAAVARVWDEYLRGLGEAGDAPAAMGYAHANV